MASFSNIVDPDDTASNDTSGLLLFDCETPICNDECVQIQRWKSAFHKLKGERVKTSPLVQSGASTGLFTK